MHRFNLRTCYPRIVDQEEALLQHLCSTVIGYEKHPLQDLEDDVAALSVELVPGEGKLVLTCSGQSALMLGIGVACGESRNSVAVEEWTFPLALARFRKLGIAINAISMDEQGLMPEALEAAARSGVNVLYTMPSVHNPLGITIGLERRQEIIRIVESYNMTIIEDAAYAYLDMNKLPSLQQLAPDRTFQILSLSKVTSLYFRAGAIVVPPHYLERVEACRRMAGCLASPIIISALARVARGNLMASLIDRKRKEGSFRQEIARKILGYEFRAHPAGWFIFLDIPQKIEGRKLVEELDQKGILVSDGNDFRAGTQGKNAIRVSLGGETSNERLIKGLGLLHQHLR